MLRQGAACTLVGLMTAVLASTPALGVDPDWVRRELQESFPRSVLERPVAPRPFQALGRGSDGRLVYDNCVGGVVLITFKSTHVGAGVLVSSTGDIITNEHVVRDSLRSGTESWLSVV